MGKALLSTRWLGQEQEKQPHPGGFGHEDTFEKTLEEGNTACRTKL